MKQVLKTNKVLLNKNMIIKMSKHIKQKLSIQNVATHFQLSTIFYFPDLLKETFDYIQRCFTMVTSTQNFLHLNINCVSKVLSSSELYVSSEMEVLHAADIWMRCKSVDRNKFAKILFFKIRFLLLSDYTLSCLRNSSSFHKNEESLLLINEVLRNKHEFYQNKSSIYYTSRYCNSNMFNILFSGEGRDVYQTEAKNLQNHTLYTRRPTPRIYLHQAVCLDNEIYCFFAYINFNGKRIFSFKKYSSVTKTWEMLGAYYLNITGSCICTFIDRIIVIGGYSDVDNSEGTSSCREYNVSKNKWKYIARMDKKRSRAACTVFQGNVVVSGGKDNHSSNTVEVYDYLENSWTYMPNMIDPRQNHNMIAISNKLFAIGGRKNTFEVYDSFCGKFLALKQPPSFLMLTTVNHRAVSIGRKVIVFRDYTQKVAFYDVDTGTWSDESCEVTYCPRDCRFFKIPQI